jgi:hypothetical protein
MTPYGEGTAPYGEESAPYGEGQEPFIANAEPGSIYRRARCDGGQGSVRPSGCQPACLPVPTGDSLSFLP